MRAIWKGNITFGLVNIPVALFPATTTEELKFRLLRASDLSPVNYKRVAEKDGREVPWDQIVKGYEYEKGKFVVLKDEDFRRVDIEATQTVNIECFVQQDEVSPIYFHKPYFMEPQKGADRAYVLLRDALEASGRIGIARVVIKTREHLAAVKPQGEGIMLELMHWATELRGVEEFRQPRESKPSTKELSMAKTLIDSMSGAWEPEAYKDQYREALEQVIQEKIEKGGGESIEAPARKPRPATNVIDLVAVLEKSLKEKAPKKTASARKRKPAAKKSTKPKRAA